jgi:hypothetical protein
MRCIWGCWGLELVGFVESVVYEYCRIVSRGYKRSIRVS